MLVYFNCSIRKIVDSSFAGIGIPLSISTRNQGLIGIGPAIGIVIGLAVGQAQEEKYKKAGLIRPLTKQEKKKKQISMWITLGSGLLLEIAIALSLIFLR